MKTALLGNVNRSPVTGMSFPHQTNVPLQSNTTEMTSFRHDFKRPQLRPSTRPVSLSEPPVHLFDCGSHNMPTDRYISTSQLAFTLPQLPPSSNQTTRSSLYRTNFKMDVDMRLKGHVTTSQCDFFSKPLEPPSREYPRSVLKLSQPGPLGNRANESLESGSEYCQSFTATPVVRDGHQMMKTHKCTDPITGKDFSDNKGSFVTTTMVTYQGESKQVDNPIPPTAKLQQARFSSIPLGSNLKMAAMDSTTHKIGYNWLSARPKYPLYSKTKANRVIHTSSLQPWDSKSIPPATTMNEMYSIHKPQERTQLVHFERNASFLPEGDTDKERVKERMSDMTSGKMHPKPPPDSYPEHIDGSKLHTQSHVPLGFGASGWNLPTRSTLNDSYKPVSVQVKHVGAPANDNIPFDYYPGHLCCSTARDSYKARQSDGAHKLNTQAVINLKRSHWKLPNMPGSTFLTTHRMHFTSPATS